MLNCVRYTSAVRNHCRFHCLRRHALTFLDLNSSQIMFQWIRNTSKFLRLTQEAFFSRYFWCSRQNLGSFIFSVIDRLRKCWIETADFGGSHDRFYKISKPRQTCNEVSANCFNVYCCLFLLPMCDRLNHLISCKVTNIHLLLNAFCWILKPKLCSKLYIKQSANCGLFKGNNEH